METGQAAPFITDSPTHFCSELVSIGGVKRHSYRSAGVGVTHWFKPEFVSSLENKPTLLLEITRQACRRFL